MIYVTGDTHGDFDRIAHFCARMNTKPSDIMIILGDAGINFFGGWRDSLKKEFMTANGMSWLRQLCSTAIIQSTPIPLKSCRMT